MKIARYILSAALALMSSSAVLAWSPADAALSTPWSENINPQEVWNRYPRPMLKRSEWKNLNGLWQYAITPLKTNRPEEYQGEILVPFAVESSLSGVGKRVGADEALWYTRTFKIPASWKDKDVLLNFGAVDWACEVWVNDIMVGTHKGGYTPFSINITPALHPLQARNTLTVKVSDPTDKGFQPRGKQVSKPSGIWYTPVTGIWQTVWLEPVNENHITSVSIVPDIDSHTVTVDITSSLPDVKDIAEVNILHDGETVASGRSINNQPVVVDMPDNFKLWNPDDPAIYDMEITLRNGNKIADRVESYTAMRKISAARDEKGVMRLRLNNKDLFQFGPLDQGWWPDGLYTAPSYEAMVFDIDKTKDWGFNMIRKHVKVEPALWYEYCDRNGILVWQDMPSGDSSPKWQTHKYFDGSEFERSPESEANYRREWKEIIDALRNHPSIVVWVPFNEAWGQFKTPEITEWTKSYDPSRLVNPASGGNHYHTGDILDIHKYPGPEITMVDGQRPTVLGEYGGIGMVVPEHIWTPDRNWGYIRFNTPAEVTDEYVKYTQSLLEMIPTCYSAAVYTQTTDVENEVNGLMTYDRKVVKIDEPRVREANKRLCNSLSH